MTTPLDINPFKKYSQFGEDGIIQSIFNRISTESKYYIEIGSGSDGKECNTRLLKEHGWRGLWVDLVSLTPAVLCHRVDKDNVNQILDGYGVPHRFDLFSLDIDSNDYWVMKSFIEKHVPRVVICEYNCYFGPDKAISLRYDVRNTWDRRSWNFGASLGAFDNLLRCHNYYLVCTSNGTNAFWINGDDVEKHKILIPTRKSVFTTISRKRKFNNVGWVNV